MGQEVVGYGSAVRDGTGDELHAAFAKLDAGARAFTIKDKDLTAPPGAPAIGDAYIVGAAATGAWATHDGKIAVFGLASTWLFVAAAEGMTAWAQDEDAEYRYNGTAWAAVTGGGAPTVHDRGTITTGTETPEHADGEMQKGVNDGAHILAAMSSVGYYVLTYTNGASAGNVTASGWDSVVEAVPGEATVAAGDVLEHTVENSVIEFAAYNDGVSKRLIATLIEDATP